MKKIGIGEKLGTGEKILCLSKEGKLIHEIRKLRQMSPNDTLTIDTTPIGVLKLMLRYEKLKIKSKSKSKNGKDKK